MNKKVCLIACDHGLGHIRRSILISHKWQSKGYDVTLYAPRESVKRLCQSSPSLLGISVVDFRTNTSLNLFKSSLSNISSWLDYLPSLDIYDFVICDNLPEILSLREDSILSAQFFWHDIINSTNKDYFNFAESLLHNHKPAIFGCDLFAMNKIKQQPNYIPQDLYKLPDLIRAYEGSSSTNQVDLLITGGSTPLVKKQLSILVDKLLLEGPGNFEYVHVDPQILPDNPPAWMAKATFTAEMYVRIKKAYCRPGLGVVTDLLTVGAEIIPIHEGYNIEMQFNESVISKIQSKNIS